MDNPEKPAEEAPASSAQTPLARARQLFGDAPADLLKRHLQALIQVEFTTVPVYLTAAYSFTNAALSDDTLSNLQQEVVSVAVQEMYHLQEACNLANAFDVSPAIPSLSFPYREEVVVEHLKGPDGQPLKHELANLYDLLGTMLAIEAPDPSDDPSHFEPNEEVAYDSIADLYHATLILLRRYLEAFRSVPLSQDPHFTPGRNQVAYGPFPTRYVFNTIEPPPQDPDPRETVRQVANAITEQGEGTLVSKQVGGLFRAAGDDGTVPYPYNSQGGRFHDFDGYTHYRRFQDVERTLGLKNYAMQIGRGLLFYRDDQKPSADLPSWAPDLATLRDALNISWSLVVDMMNKGFNAGKLDPEGSSDPNFFDVMLSFKYIIPLVWQSGYCPSFEYRPGVTAEDFQRAMDKADPWCLFHWDARSNEVRAKAAQGTDGFRLNACQGLNACKGQGWGGIATGEGTGACATADFHSCQGGNSCSYQGGCGFLSMTQDKPPQPLPAAEQWIPGQNTGKTSGGCQTPIAAGQYFDCKPQIPAGWSDDDKKRIGGLEGKSVWQHARDIFAPQSALDPPQTIDGVDYDGGKRRASVAPSSPKC